MSEKASATERPTDCKAKGRRYESSLHLGRYQLSLNPAGRCSAWVAAASRDRDDCFLVTTDHNRIPNFLPYERLSEGRDVRQRPFFGICLVNSNNAVGADGS